MREKNNTVRTLKRKDTNKTPLPDCTSDIYLKLTRENELSEPKQLRGPPGNYRGAPSWLEGPFMKPAQP